LNIEFIYIIFIKEENMNNPLKVLSSVLITTSLSLLLLLNPAVNAKDSPVIGMSKEVANQQMVNLNNSSLAELLTLKGVGQTKAKAIIDYRQQVGQFKSVKELTKVSGVGNKIVSENKTRLSI
jgi:competence protein ComEA